MRVAKPILPVLLVLAACAPFAPALDAFFVGDDFDFLRVVSRMDGASGALRSTFWGEYMPAFTWSFMLDLLLWDRDPSGYHLTSLLFHAGAVLAFWRLAHLLTADDRFAATAAALLFAVQPIHDEAVIYIAARGHVMMTAFLLVALTFHAGYRWSGRAPLLIPATGFLGLALLSKETAILAPLFIVAAELLVWRDGRRRRAIVGLAPIALLALAYPLMRALVLDVPGDKVLGVLEYGWEWDRLPVYFMLELLPLPGRWLDGSLVAWLAPIGTAALAAVSLWAGLRFRRERNGTVLYALAFFAIATAPFLLDTLSTRRRYAYLGSLGVCMLVGLLSSRLWRAEGRLKRSAGLAIVLSLVLGGAVATVERSRLYRAAGQISRGVATDFASMIDPTAERVTLELFQLPNRVGGGSLDGAYLFHHTDLRSAARVFGGVDDVDLRTAIRLEHSADHRCETRVEPDGMVLLKMTSRTAGAHRALVEALAAKVEDRVWGPIRVQRVDDQRRSIVVTTRPESRRPGALRLVFSDGRLRPLARR